MPRKRVIIIADLADGETSELRAAVQNGVLATLSTLGQADHIGVLLVCFFVCFFCVFYELTAVSH